MKTQVIVILMAGLFIYALNSVAKGNPDGEPIYAIKLSNGTAKIWVRSTGCTKREHFDVQVTNHGTYRSLLFTRTKEDRCRRMPTMIALSFLLPTSKVLPGDLLFLDNPLSLWRSHVT